MIPKPYILNCYDAAYRYVCSSSFVALRVVFSTSVLSVAIYFVLRYMYLYEEWLQKSTKHAIKLTHPRVRWLTTNGSGLESWKCTKSVDMWDE